MAEPCLPLSWYPAALSAELGRRPFPVRIFGDDYLLYRAHDGEVSAVWRYCAHMGADLSNGRVVGDGLRCGLHGWIYGRDGVCRHIPGTPPGAEALLKRLAVHETGGIVLLWPGPQPDWPFPELPGIPVPIAARPRVIDFNCPIEAVGLNGFDIWHFSIVHRRRVKPGVEISHHSAHHISLGFSAEVMPGKVLDELVIRLGGNQLDVKLDYWGGNLILVRNMRSNYLALLALAPAGPERCRIFIAVYLDRRSGAAASLRQTIQLEVFRWVAYSFLKADFPFVAGMRPSDAMLIEGKDDVAKEFWRWWRALPRGETMP